VQGERSRHRGRWDFSCLFSLIRPERLSFSSLAFEQDESQRARAHRDNNGTKRHRGYRLVLRVYD